MPGDAEASVDSKRIAALLGHGLRPQGKAAKIATLVEDQGFTASFTALGPGTLVIAWYYEPPARPGSTTRAKPILVASGHMAFSSARTAKVKIKLTPAGKRLLKAVKSLKLTARGTFTAAGKTPIIATKVFVLKK
jgi:hypothetical protein